MTPQPSPGDQRNVSTRRFGPKLCHYCNEFFSHFESGLRSFDGKGFGYHPTIKSFRDAVESGCQLCILIEHQTCHYDIDDDLWKDSMPILQGVTHSRSDDLYALSLRSRGKIYAQIDGAPVSHFAYPGTSEREIVSKELRSMERHHELKYTPPDSTDSPVAWELCRSWINNCVENHDRCKRIQPGTLHPRKWPARLLYIGGLGYGNLSDDHLNSLNIQLHLKQDKRFKGSYMTLSHCWGDSSRMLKLTHKNYKKWTETGFSYRDLPKTFQDAVRFSLFLRNDYLWIDSLCIIQRPDPPAADDSSDLAEAAKTAGAETDAEAAKEDWIRESKTMADVYRYSKCNIAATASRGPTEGCFYPRKHPMTVISPLEITFHFGETEKRYLFLDIQLWSMNVDRAPLNKRAWVIQERISAPRQIHCGREQLLWECYETTACETFPFIFEYHEEVKPFPLSTLTNQLSGLRLDLTLAEISYLRDSKTNPDAFPGCRICDNKIRNLFSPHDKLERVPKIERELTRLKGATRDEWIVHAMHHLYDEWVDIIKLYSRCTLSVRSDKLVAISGIVSRMQDVLKDIDDYVAGLWRSQLPWQLLWRNEAGYIGNDLNSRKSYEIGATLGAPRYDIGPSWSWASVNMATGWLHSDRSLYQESGDTLMIDILDVSDGHTATGKDTLNVTEKESPLKLRCLLYAFSMALKEFHIYIDLDSEESRMLLERASVIPITGKGYNLSGLVVSPCPGRPDFYKRIACWHGILKEGSKVLFEHIMGATDEDRKIITVI